MEINPKKYERTIFQISLISIVFLPILWSIGFSYHLYGQHPWPGISLYSHFSILGLFFLFLKWQKRIKNSSKFLISIFYFYLFYTIIYSVFYLLLSNSDYKYKAFTESMLSSAYIFSYTLLGFFIVLFNPIKFFKYIYLFIFTLLFVFEFNIKSTIPISLYTIYGDFHDAISNYQLVSFSIVILGISFFVSKDRINLIIIPYCLLLVFLTGGRSEFFGSVISITFVYLYINFTSLIKRFSIKNNTILFFIFLLISFSFLIYFYPEISSNRNFQISNINEASSWISRKELLNKNLQFIEKTPFLGDYGGHFLIEKGGYIHNILSAWQQYGLIGFITYILLVTTPFCMALFFYLKYENRVFLTSIFISTYCLLLVIVSKSVFWPVIGLSIGSFLGSVYLYKSKTSDNS